jgi:membrane protein
LFAATIGVCTLLFAAIWIVVALKEALNTIWDVVALPSAGIWSIAKSYLASVVGVLVLGFLLLVSLLVTTVLTAAAA